MIQRITGPLPDWAERTNPLLSYQLRQSERISSGGRVLRGLGIALGLLVLAVGGYAEATSLFTRPPGQNLTESVVQVLFYPMVIVQVVISISALGLTIGTISEERSHMTWDNLRATPKGAALTFRTRWAAVFYRLRGLLGLVTLVRLVLIAGVLLDLTAFQGRYLDLLTGGITPDLPNTIAGVPVAVPLGALLLSLFLTAALVLPFTTVALDASVGLLLSTLLKQRVYSLIVQFLLFVLRVALVAVLVLVVTAFLEGRQSPIQLQAVSWQAWLAVFGFSAIADWGLLMLHLGFSGEMWATVPYGIFIGPLLLVYALVQASLADVLLRAAVNLAEDRG